MEKLNVSRREVLGMAAVGAVGLAAGGCATYAEESRKPSGGGSGPLFGYDRNGTCVRHPLVKDAVRFTVVTDSHFAMIDGRDEAWKDHAKRMAQWPGKEKDLDAAFAAAKKHGAEMVALTGDMISFPSLANVAFMERRMKESAIDCRYIAGNHDWHFEGVPGTDNEQRAKWIRDRLLPLYRGEDPMGYSVVLKGLRCVFIDDSTYHILPEQLAFMRRELATGEPVCLFMHIPLYLTANPRRNVGVLAHPEWGAATDGIWQIERRMRWPEAGPTAETRAFRRLVLSAPNMVAVFAGHEHVLQIGQEGGVPQFVVPSANGGAYMNVTIEGMEGER